MSDRTAGDIHVRADGDGKYSLCVIAWPDTAAGREADPAAPYTFKEIARAMRYADAVFYSAGPTMEKTLRRVLRHFEEEADSPGDLKMMELIETTLAYSRRDLARPAPPPTENH